MENFVYEYPTKVYFGKGAAKEHLGKALDAFGPNVLLAYGGGSIRKNGIYDEIMEILHDAGKSVAEFSGIMPNPTYAKVQEGAKLARAHHADLILAVGGGSVIDCCKIAAAQAKTTDDIWEMEFTEHRFPAGLVPLGAVVTASGTGADTMSVPEGQVISGAFDTLSHAMETYFGRADRDNVSDEVAEAIMRSTIINLRALLKDMSDYTARSNLMWTSAMAENGVLKVGRLIDFQAHQIEHQLGAYTDCNHGQGLAVIHPALYRLAARKAPAKFARFAVNVWGIPRDGRTEEELASAGVSALTGFIKECGLPTHLKELRMKADAEQLLTPALLKTVADSCNLIQTSYVVLSHEDIYSILTECL